MRNYLKKLMLIAVVGVIFGCAANTFAQTNVPPIKVGGFGEVDTADKTVVAAANFAVKSQAKKQKVKIKLIGINYATRQVVAGMNYQVCLNIETTDRKTKTAVPQNAQAVVYQNLKGQYKLTSWTVAACTDGAPNVPVN